MLETPGFSAFGLYQFFSVTKRACFTWVVPALRQLLSSESCVLAVSQPVAVAVTQCLAAVRQRAVDLGSTPTPELLVPDPATSLCSYRYLCALILGQYLPAVVGDTPESALCPRVHAPAMPSACVSVPERLCSSLCVGISFLSMGQNCSSSPGSPVAEQANLKVCCSQGPSRIQEGSFWPSCIINLPT